MATFTVLAGDFPKAPTPLIAGHTIQLPHPAGSTMRSFRAGSPYESVHAAEIASLEVVGQATGKSFGGAAVAGIAGGLVLGPVGLLAGALAGGNRDAVTFQLTLRDGRRVLGSAKPAAFQALQAAEFECRGQEPPPRVEAKPPEPLTWKGIAVRVGVVALLLGGVYVGMTVFADRFMP
jgi:hypothetical protein